MSLSHTNRRGWRPAELRNSLYVGSAEALHSLQPAQHVRTDRSLRHAQVRPRRDQTQLCSPTIRQKLQLAKMSILCKPSALWKLWWSQIFWHQLTDKSDKISSPVHTALARIDYNIISLLSVVQPNRACSFHSQCSKKTMNR